MTMIIGSVCHWNRMRSASGIINRLKKIGPNNRETLSVHQACLSTCIHHRLGKPNQLLVINGTSGHAFKSFMNQYPWAPLSGNSQSVNLRILRNPDYPLLLHNTYHGLHNASALNNSETSASAHSCQQQIDEGSQTRLSGSSSDHNCFYFHPTCSPGTRQEISSCFEVVLDFISAEEEQALLQEVEPHFKRLRYEFDHWDDAIVGFRETEIARWSSRCGPLLERVRQHSFHQTHSTNNRVLVHTHILDLAEDGYIKPHVDSVKFCGSTITGLSLGSQAVMRLVRLPQPGQQPQQTDQLQSQQRLPQNHQQRQQTLKQELQQQKQQQHSHDEQKQPPEPLSPLQEVVDVLLPARSLYVMRDAARYHYTHEVLSNDCSRLNQLPVHKTRRVSVICRNQP